MHLCRAMSTVVTDIKEIEARLKEAGVPVEAMLANAGVDRSTWTRWKAGAFSPRLSKWRDVESAVRAALSNDREAA